MWVATVMSINGLKLCFATNKNSLILARRFETREYKWNTIVYLPVDIKLHM